MFLKKYKIPLEVYSINPISKNSYSPHKYSMYETNIGELNLAQSDIDNLDGQYDWIDAWADDEYDRKIMGFNNKDVLMEVIYEKGNYIVTLVSDKPFDTIVRNNRYCSNTGPWDEITLEEAVVRYINGCLSDGIGENPISYIRYQGEVCDVWLGNLIEM